MQVIPVLDLKGGKAVHAVRGERERYAPVEGVLGSGHDPVALARAFRDRLGLQTCYVADLDAIAGRQGNTDLLRALVGLGLTLWVDAGVSRPEQAQALARLGVEMVIVGTETLPSADHLRQLAADFPPDRLVLSVDRKGGALLAPPDIKTPQHVMALAAELGIRRVILLDLAHVGAAAGPPLDLLTSLRPLFPDLAFYVGGGVRHRADLDALAQAGAAGALVATALHRGTLFSDQ